MELDHEFTVPVPMDRAWPVLLDPERVAPCVPGATLDSIGDQECTGKIKVRLGAMTITYRGTARIRPGGESGPGVTIEGSAREARGSGTAVIVMRATPHDEGDTTRITVQTELTLTGRPARLSRDLLSEVGRKLIARFAKSLADELTRGPEWPPAEAPDDVTEVVPVVPQPESAGRPQAAQPPGPDDPTEVVRVEPVPRRTRDAPASPVSKAPAPAWEGFDESVPPRTMPDAASAARESGPAGLVATAGSAAARRWAPMLAAAVALLVVRRVVRRRRIRSGGGR